MTALVSLDGVLRTEVGDPIHSGLKLFRTLLMSYRVVVATDGTKEEAEHWLRSNMIMGYADIFDNRIAFEGQDLRLRHLSLAKQTGAVELFVDCDTDRCKSALASGTPVLLFAHPTFLRRKRPVRAWDELEQEIKAQKELKARVAFDGPLDRWE